MNNIATFEDLGKAKTLFMFTLGDKSTMYMKLMKSWFKMELSKLEFDIEVRKFLTPDQFRMHNRLMVKMFSLCSDLQFGPPSPSLHKSTNAQSSKRKRQHSTSFQLASLLDYLCDTKIVTTENNIENKTAENVKYFLNEMCILDESILFGRFTHAAWENNLNGASIDCAKLLYIGVQNFLKNVITAILSERCGYKVKGKYFIYEMGLPVPNPWLYCSNKMDETELCTSRISAKKNANLIGSGLAFGYEQALELPSKEQVELNILYCMAKENPKAQQTLKRKAPVSVPEALNALRVNRSSILSHSIYFACMERLISAHTHPGADEL